MTTHSEEDISRIENKGKENGKKEALSSVMRTQGTATVGLYIWQRIQKRDPRLQESLVNKFSNTK